MDTKVTCELCGGNEFYKESGFYYCNECLTQTQEIQEHVLEVPTLEANVIVETKHKKSSRSSKSHEKKQQVTSWECYNYIILGLVEELIQLGAKPELKGTVQRLWFAYLKVLEVVHEDPLEPPRLQPYNITGDAEAIYGRIPKSKLKRKRVKRGSDSSCTNTDYSEASHSSKNKIKGKKRRAMALAEYEKFSSTQVSNASILNQSLQSLKSGSDPTITRSLMFNTSAEEILHNLMTKEHLGSHKDDTDSLMDCHEFTRRRTPYSYVIGPMILTRNKIYAIIYLGLLLVKDQIQLADMLRFIREGKMSYQYIDQFYPEELENCEIKLVRQKYAAANPLLHASTRKVAYQLANLLGILDQIPLQNIVKITERYVAELNLPSEIQNYVLKIISRTEPKFNIPKKHTELPNYEARIGSIIIFVLKLLYGLDDVTESEQSVSANMLNERQNTVTYFDYIKWRDFIEYRKLIIGQYHFPTCHLLDDTLSQPDLYCDFLSEVMSRQQIDGDLHKSVQDVDHLLKKLMKETGRSNQLVTFPTSLTPFKDYLRVVETLSDFKSSSTFDKKLLCEDFREDNIDFLVHPTLHYPGNVLVQNKGANDKLELVKMELGSISRRSRFEPVVIKDGVKSLNISAPQVPSERKIAFQAINRPDQINHDLRYKKQFKKNRKRSKSCPTTAATKLASSVTNESEEMFLHYNPEERFWIHSTYVKSWRSSDEFMNLFKLYPYNYQLLVREIARLTEQNVEDILSEYIVVELYLRYYYDFINDEFVDFKAKPAKKEKKVARDPLLNLVGRAKLFW